jgi:hypothetical protein
VLFAKQATENDTIMTAIGESHGSNDHDYVGMVVLLLPFCAVTDILFVLLPGPRIVYDSTVARG